MGAEMPHGSDRPPLLRAVLRHHWPTVVAAVVICALVGTAVGLAKARSYRSTATVLIAPLEGVPYSPESVARQSQANTDALTDARLAATPAVARLVEESLRLPGNSLAWRSSLSVEVVPNTQVVKIGFRASSARRARQMANAFSTDYLRYRATRSQASVSGQLASLQSRAQQVQRRLTAANRALVSNQPSANRTSLNQQVTIYTDQLAALSIQTAQLSGASRDPGQVLTPAGSAAATGVPRAALTLVGALVGLLLGLAIAFVRESGDRRLREPWDVESAGLPVLATLKAPQSAPPDAEEVERYRTLRTAVLTHAPAPRVIAVTALSPTTLSADVAAGLGTALARGGSEATIVLASPGSRASGELRAGLAEVLLEDADARELRDNAGPSLYLLEPGRQIEAAAELFASEKLRTALRDLAGSSGYVLVAAPVTGTAASTALAVVCDAVVLVSTLEDSTLQDLTAAMDEVQRVRGHVLGAVAVQPTRRGDPRLRKASSSLPRITRGSVTRWWRALIPGRTGDEGTAAERSRAQSTGATAVTHRIARAAEPRDLSATAAPPATDDSSLLPSDGAAATAESPATPTPSKSRKSSATKQPSLARKRKS